MNNYHNPYGSTGQSPYPYGNAPSTTGIKQLAEPPKQALAQVQPVKKTQEQINIENEFVKQLQYHKFDEKEQSMMINIIIDKKEPVQVIKNSNMNILQLMNMWNKFKLLAASTGNITQEQINQIAKKFGIPV